MKIQAEIIADSKNTFGDRITTMKITFPRFILAEFNTHRMLSKNSASSRAIPFKKMVKMVEENPFIPIAWQKDHKGMQGNEYHTSGIGDIESSWLRARNNAIEEATELNMRGVTKQLCNRLLEPFMWHTVIVTATEWENFFALRCPKYDGKLQTWRSWRDVLSDAKRDEALPEEHYKELENMSILDRLQHNKGQAEIHIMSLAEAMWDAMNESIPKELKAGEWHIPFGDNMDYSKLVTLCPEDQSEDVFSTLAVKIATARCARISYETFGDSPKIDYEADLKLHDMLSTSGHWSPFEHCAKAMTRNEYNWLNGTSGGNRLGNGWSGNFKGFMQYRKMFENENIK